MKYCFGEAKEFKNQYTNLFSCRLGTMPFKYLVIPIIHIILRNNEWTDVVERFKRKFNQWKGKVLSSRSRLILFNVVLSNLPIFMMSFFEVPDGVLKKLDTLHSKFSWEWEGHQKKYHLTKWRIHCLPKDQGAPGVTNLHLKNICLLSKWFFQLLNEDGVWQRLSRHKYFDHQPLTQI